MCPCAWGRLPSLRQELLLVQVAVFLARCRLRWSSPLPGVWTSCSGPWNAPLLFSEGEKWRLPSMCWVEPRQRGVRPLGRGALVQDPSEKESTHPGSSERVQCRWKWGAVFGKFVLTEPPPGWESAWSLQGRGSLGAIQRLVLGSQGTLKEGFVLHRPLCGELCLRAGMPPPLLGGCVPASSLHAVGPGGRFTSIFGMSCFQ